MGEPTTMTIRIDSGLKDAMNQEAQAQGVSMTEYLQRAMRSAMHASCRECGRSSLPGSLPAGFTPAFEQWVAEHKRVNPNGPFMLTTAEGEPRVYWATLHHDRNPMEGMFMVDIRLDQDGRKCLPFGIPRGVITGWREDGDGYWYSCHAQLGYTDGNAILHHKMIEAQRVSTAVPPRPKRRR